jgi:DNA-binding LytR/AlgR family response regulator
VKIDDILFLESDKNYIFVHTFDQKLWVRTSFHEFIELIDGKQFVRIHKGFMVNVSKVTTINSDKLFIDAIEIPVGKVYRDDLLRQLMIV